MLALIALHQELRQLWDHLRVKLERPVGCILQIIEEVVKLLKGLLTKVSAL